MHGLGLGGGHKWLQLQRACMLEVRLLLRLLPFCMLCCSLRLLI